MKKIYLIFLLLSPIFVVSQDVPGKRGRLDTLKAFSTNYSQLDSQWFVSRTHFTRPQRFDSTVDFHQGLKYLNTYNITFPPQSGTFLLSPDSTLIRTFSDSLYGRKANTNIWSASNYWTTPQHFRDSVFIGTQSTLNNELLNVASNTDADIKAWTASASDLSSVNLFRSRGTITAPSDIVGGDVVSQFRGFGYYSGAFKEIGNMVFGDHNKPTPSGFFSLKVKSENVTNMTTDTSVIIAFPYMEYGATQNYGVWLGSKTTAMATIPAAITLNGTMNAKWASSFDSVVAFTRGFSVGGSSFVDASRNISNGLAISATGLMTLGSGSSALAHKVKSNSAVVLDLTRGVSGASSLSYLTFSTLNASSSEIAMGQIGAGNQTASPLAGIESGQMTFGVRRGGTMYQGVRLDSNVSLHITYPTTGVAASAPSSISRFTVTGSSTQLYLERFYRGGNGVSFTEVGNRDTSGNMNLISGTLTTTGTLSSGAITSTGKIQSGGVTSVGLMGVANIVDTVTYGAVSSSIASRNLPSTAGTYRISYFMGVQTAGLTGTVQATISYNNGVARTLTSASLNLTLTTESDNNAFIYKVTSGTPTVVVTVTGATGSPVYSFDAVVERLK